MDASIVKGFSYSQRMPVQSKDASIVKGCYYSQRMLVYSKDATCLNVAGANRRPKADLLGGGSSPHREPEV